MNGIPEGWQGFWPISGTGPATGAALIEAGTGTLIKIRHEGFAGIVEAIQSHGEGWKRVLGWLLAFAENNETVDSRE